MNVTLALGIAPEYHPRPRPAGGRQSELGLTYEKRQCAFREGRFTMGVVPVRRGRASDRPSRSAGHQVSAWSEVGVTTRIVLGLRVRIRGRWSAFSNARRAWSWRRVVRSIAILAVGIAATWTVAVTVGSWIAALVGAVAFVVWLAESRRRVIPASPQTNPVRSRSQTQALNLNPEARAIWSSSPSNRGWSRRNL